MTALFMLHDNLRSMGRQWRQKWAQGISILLEHQLRLKREGVSIRSLQSSFEGAFSSGKIYI